MKQNEYNAAEVVEIGPAQEIVLGEKIDVRDFDSLTMDPFDWRYVEP
jgi:hypothetical protein